MKKIAIYIADDHPAVIEGLSRHLADTGNYEIVGTAIDGTWLLNDEKLKFADVLILDLNMPNTDGLNALTVLKEKGFECKIIVNSSYNSKELINDVHTRGANGFLSKSSQLNELIDTIKRVTAGELVFPNNTIGLKDDQSFYLHDDFLKKYRLTKREVEIIQLVCKNKKTKEIALELNISEFTVSTHRKNIGFKLGVGDSIIELYEFAKNNKLID